MNDITLICEIATKTFFRDVAAQRYGFMIKLAPFFACNKRGRIGSNFNNNNNNTNDKIFHSQKRTEY